MKIKVIGSGCPSCKKLHQMILNLKVADVEYSNDITELIELGIMEGPVILINGKVANVGMPKDEQSLLSIINSKK